MTEDAPDELSELLEAPMEDHGLADDGEVTIIPESPTALKLDDWSLRRGEEVFAASEMLKKAMPDVDKRKAELATADFHSAAFEPTHELAERCTDEKISRYMKNLMDTPEFKALHAETQLDDVSAEIAATHFAVGWVAMCKATKDDSPSDSPLTPEGEFAKDMEALKFAMPSLIKAEEEVSDVKDTMAALSMGGTGPMDSSMSPAEVRKLFTRVRKSRTLQRICNLAGRFRRMAQSMQRAKVQHGYDDMIGTKLDGVIGKLLPSELASLADEDLEYDAMRRIVESAAQCRDFEGLEGQAKGPIVVIVDESGSMSGEKVAKAKAFALAMYWIAKHQKRWCCLMGYSGSANPNYVVLKPGESKQKELMAWLEHFYSGGTDLDIPVDVLPKMWNDLGCPEGKTDIIQITDAACHVPKNIRERFNDWKHEVQAKYFCIVLNDDAAEIELVADRIWLDRDIDVESESVGEVMSIV
jgi:uncharacterized protein with von Willebrand factor type A (vWA) domain